ncbi:hypothetical protein GCM10010277_84150 [Streptomyces longisporoflavus]|uniref:hypothetical protein n=1 Tax=Streptomyces longisporoflavus TaxID=28044 RepID=UPI00167C9FF7|nr:hypothetical protein [Streptomyces longisporoflavus]GGV71851.1 hypothetical protein GCM10010277_84150 [Streptomyces longisporoflavus]
MADDEAVRNLRELGDRVQRRRHELALSVGDLSRKASIGRDAVTGVEAGRPIDDRVYRKLDAALEWNPGTCINIAQGAPRAEITEQEIGKAVFTALAEHDDIPADRIRAIRDSVIADLKGRGLL